MILTGCFRGDSGAGLPQVLLFRGREVCGALAGNGGKMAEGLELETDNASRKRGSAPKNRARKRTARARGGGKAAAKDGAELLRQAADRQVGRVSEELADMLTKEALRGHLASTKMLVALAGAKKPAPEPVVGRRLCNFVERLASEPQWKGDSEQWVVDSEQPTVDGEQGLGTGD